MVSKLKRISHLLCFAGLRQREASRSEASSSSGTCCNDHNQPSTSGDSISKYNGTTLEQLIKSKNTGLLKLSPMDDVEGEIIFYQHKLLSNTAARKRLSGLHFTHCTFNLIFTFIFALFFFNPNGYLVTVCTDDLISKVARSLQEEINAARKQEWDSVLVSKYLYELREARKQGRKERRHKEAQAVLAAATAAAAASSRMSSLRKDNLEESIHHEVIIVQFLIMETSKTVLKTF